MTSTFLLLLFSVCATIAVSVVASAAVGFGDETIISTSQSRKRNQRPKGPIKPYNPTIKGRQPPQEKRRNLLNQLKDSGTTNKYNGLNLLKDGTTTTSQGGGAFNPNLVSYDPNSQNYKHDNVAEGSSTTIEEFNPCPSDFTGNRASHDCSSYIYCNNGVPSGQYYTCSGLKFDNGKGSCQWSGSVDCEGDRDAIVATTTDDDNAATGDDEEGSSESSSSKVGGTTSVVIGSATSIAVSTTYNVGSVGATANEGSDWGGTWQNGVWISNSEVTNDNSLAWLDNQWDGYDIVPYPPHPILPFMSFTPPIDNSSIPSLPQSCTSYEGWSKLTRTKPTNGKPKNIIGYYVIWQVYDNDKRALPTNMDYTKLDRVNYAFFQTDLNGNVWGMDSYNDPVVLFGPHDWSKTMPDHAGHYPQFYDDNGFDDTQGSDWNYVGSQYLPHPTGVYCHRTTPTGRRDCNGHRASDGLIGRAHDQGAEVYVSIGGWSKSEVFVGLSANAVSRRNFAKNCVGLIREYNFDGIDIDWEFPGYSPHGGTADDAKNFVLLLQDIRSALDAYTNVTYPNGERTFGLTAALPCHPSIINIQDVPKISDILSEMNLLTFDFHGTWDDVVGINSPLYDPKSPEHSASGCVEHWVRDGADKSKINLGVPFYGRSYGGATELGAPFDGADGMHWWADEGRPQYYNVLDQLPDMISIRDDATKTQVAYFEDGGILSFDDSQAVCDKVEYGRENELHGYMVWELAGDLTDDHKTPLLDVINYKLDQGDVFDCELWRLETRDENGDVIGLKPRDPNPWYVATWESGTCINDGMQPEWEKEDNLFRRKEECCAHKFEYRMRDCIGPPTPPPTSTPTPEPTSSPVSSDEPTTGPSNVFGAALVIDPVASPSPVAREAQGPAPPETWCLGGCDINEKCVGNQNHPQGVDDKTCRPCLSGQTYWPCDVDGLCFCWDETTPRIPPAPGSGLAQLSDERPCDYFTETIFNSLAPDSQHPYTYDGLCKAIDSYNEGHAEKIFMMGTEEERKSELAAFLGHTLHESDEWKASREYLMCADNKVVDGKTYCKPCDSGSFNWETFKCDGVGLVGDGLTFNGYCDFTIEPPQACPCDGALESETGDLEGYIPASKVFFGRGAIQLSWNYNFRAASEALTGDATTFCDDPDLVAITPEYAWGAGVFFWMENLKEETTCHIEALRSFDFGGTLNNINGGLECPAYHGGWHGEAIKLRLNRYCKSSAALGLESILIFDGCKGLNTSFVECLEDGTCPDCQQFSDGTEPIVIEGATIQQLDPIITADATVEEPVEVTESDSTPTATTDPPPAVEETVEVEEEVIPEVISEAELPQEQDQIVQLDESAASFSCPEDLKPVDGLPGCCVTEPAYHGDGACDPDSPFNTPECAFDGGDCCQETCDLTAHYGCSVVSSEFGPFGFFCIDPSMEDEYIDPESCTVSDRTRIGDGRCDAGVEMYNSEACNWDGGDCCVETCNQVYSHYDCGNYDCQNPDYATPDTQSPSKSPTSSPIKDSSSPTTSPIAPKSLAGSISSSFASGYASSSSTETEPSLSTQSEPLSSTQTNVVTVIASDDATIEKSSPGSNHGSESILKVKGLPNGPNAHDAIMRFIIPAAQGLSATTPVHALLKIYSLSESNHGGIVHTASETDWKEGDVTWDTAPEWDTRIDNVGAIEVDHWNIIDVSNVVSSLNGNEGAITIRIRSRDPAVIEYSSKEGDHPPQIIVSYGELTSFTTDASDPETEPDTVVTTPEPTQKPTPQPVEVTTTTSTTSTSQSLLEKVDAVHVLSPSDDATILSDHPYENYGSDSSLQVDNDSGVYDALIKFDLSGLDTSAVSSAMLRLYCIDGSDAGGIFGKTITSNWDESSVTWDTAPAAYGSPLHSLGSVEKATWYEIDVTNLFSEGSLDTVSIRMTSSSWNRAGYSSKEGLHPPQLVIQGAEEASFIDSIVAEPTTDNVSVSQEQAALVTGTGLFFPVWGTGGSISCIDGTVPPSWASGAYLKASKADCCNAFFSMQIDMCLKA